MPNGLDIGGGETARMRSLAPQMIKKAYTRVCTIVYQHKSQRGTFKNNEIAFLISIKIISN